jgi:two-component system NtrC family sensor kinase
VIGLRNFSRVEEKEYKPVDLHISIDTTLNLLNSEFKNRIEVKKDYGQLPAVTCNQTQINQVFMNILSNAAQAIEGPGTVWISTRLHASPDNDIAAVSVSIQDTGPGVTPEVLQKIFDPFFTTKGVGKGTGLGLAISYGIISAHGGDIKVSSKIGTGTEFVITLPLKPPPPAEEI